MPKFRSGAVTSKTENLAGGEAYKQSTRLELVSLLLTSFVEDKFYESADSQVKRIGKLIAGFTSPEDRTFAAKAAIYARTTMGMRSITHVLAGELFRKPSTLSGTDWGKRFVSKVVHRPDDALEILSYFMKNVMEKSIPNQLRKGLALSIKKFDEYQLSKYRGERSDLKLVDLFNLVRPAPSNGEQEVTYERLMSGELKNRDTWETKISATGKADTQEEKEELKAQAWSELIGGGKIGYFALLKNLRNIIQQAPEAVGAACQMLKNEKLIKNSLVFPFRYQTALEEIKKIAGPREVIMALNDALELSCSNVPRFDGKTLIALDTSGSMQGKPLDIGSLFAAILAKSNEADVLCFDTSSRFVPLNPQDSLLSIQKEILSCNLGGGTDFKQIFSSLQERYDRIIILSDMQAWVGYNLPSASFKAYKDRSGATPYIYSFDLQGHGTMQFPEDKVFTIAGFSDKILGIMGQLEQDKNALIKEIENITI